MSLSQVMQRLPSHRTSINLYHPFLWIAGLSAVLAAKYSGVADTWSQNDLPYSMIAGFLFEACVEGTAVTALPFFAIRFFKQETVFAHPSEYLWMTIGVSTTWNVISFVLRWPSTILIYSAGAFLAAWICRHHTWKWFYVTLGVLGWTPRLPPLVLSTNLDYFSFTVAACVAHAALTAIVLAIYTTRCSPTRCGLVGFTTQLGIVLADLGLLLSLTRLR